MSFAEKRFVDFSMTDKEFGPVYFHGSNIFLMMFGLVGVHQSVHIENLIREERSVSEQKLRKIITQIKFIHQRKSRGINLNY